MLKYIILLISFTIYNIAYCHNNIPETVLPKSANQENRNYRQYITQSIIDKAEAGDRDFQFELAKRYAEGTGTEKNHKEAIYWLEKSASQGQADALFYLGWIHLNGKGVKKNQNTALHFLERAAKKNDAYAQYLTAQIYEENKLLNYSDISKSYYWYQRACNNYILLACEGEKRLNKVIGIIKPEYDNNDLKPKTQ